MDFKNLSANEILEKLKEYGYFTSYEVALAIKNAVILEKPILIEGPPGVGKTELAKAISHLTGDALLRLQCSPEMNERKALYDFDYAKQLLYIQLLKDDVFKGSETMTVDEKIKQLHSNNPFYSEDFLIKRPILEAFMPEDNKSKVLLIDEIDKADEEIEYGLLEAFSDYTISIPEIGTIEAQQKPITIVTSNRKRKISDTFARRCIYLYLNYPTIEEEAAILETKANVNKKLAKDIAKIVSSIRELKLTHVPSIAESIEWVRVLQFHLNDEDITKELLIETLPVIAKTQSDREKIKNKIQKSTMLD